MAKGIINAQGRVTITWDSQAEVLLAPDGAHGVRMKYLPCSECGRVHQVELNVVAMICEECAELHREGLERCQICGVPDGKFFSDPNFKHLIAIVEHQAGGKFQGHTICQLCREGMEVVNA